ncbi:MAG: NAD(P)H-hydrate dehydratase [bacterium]
MIPLVTADEMRKLDQMTIEKALTGLRLMENAGRGVVENLIGAFKPEKSSTIVIICGKGNNGGDGFVVSRLLKRKGYKVRVFLIGTRDEVTGDAAVNLSRCVKAGIRVFELNEKNFDTLENVIDKCSVVVDAIFGTGFQGEPKGIARKAIELINNCSAKKISVDIPSGVNASTGEAVTAVKADLTVTMALPKRGLVLFPGRIYAGRMVAQDIGIPFDLISQADLKTFLLTPPDVATALPKRSPSAHKWSCGHVVVISGSRGLTGAASLTSISALRAGAGLVTLAIPESLNPILEVKLTEVMTYPVDETPEASFSIKAKEKLLKLVEKATVVALGPGLSQNPETKALVRQILPVLGKPCVLDADGINALAGHLEILKSLTSPLVVTPHPGEASRLLGIETSQIIRDPIESARRAASQLGVVFVLKGAPTFIARPDGNVFVNPTGNAGLATAGSGDVLTGLISGLIAQGMSIADAACAGVFIHGELGEMLLREKGYYGFLAGDLSERIPQAIASILNWRKRE